MNRKLVASLLGGLGLGIGLAACGTTSPNTGTSAPSAVAPQSPQPSVMHQADTWVTGDNISYTVTWSLHGPDAGRPMTPGHPNTSYLEVDVKAVNGGDQSGVQPSVSAASMGDGGYLDSNYDVALKAQQPPLLPGEAGTFRSTYVPPAPGTVIKVSVMDYDHVANRPVTGYWTGPAS